MSNEFENESSIFEREALANRAIGESKKVFQYGSEELTFNTKGTLFNNFVGIGTNNGTFTDKLSLGLSMDKNVMNHDKVHNFIPEVNFKLNKNTTMFARQDGLLGVQYHLNF